MNKRNYLIDLFRFVFCLVIVNYHYFSHYAKNLPIHFFSRGYMADEFFFLISGFFLAEASVKTDKSPIDFTVDTIIHRVKKIALPYYLVWILCFIGNHITDYVLAGPPLRILQDLANSIYELSFIQMFGFVSGYYSNSLSWFFSALLITVFIISPFIVKFREVFTLYIAPLISLFCSGALSINYDYLYGPYYIMGDSYVIKGLVRAIAAISLGAFLHGIACCKQFQALIQRLNNNVLVIILDAGMWLIVLTYMVFPFITNNDDPSVEYDFIIIAILFFALLPVLSNMISIQDERFFRLAKAAGTFSFYAFFAQSVYYSIDQLVYKNPLPSGLYSLILNVSVFALTAALWLFVNKIEKNRSLTRKEV